MPAIYVTSLNFVEPRASSTAVTVLHPLGSLIAQDAPLGCYMGP
jgi:hypothetical protein